MQQIYKRTPMPKCTYANVLIVGFTDITIFETSVMKNNILEIFVKKTTRLQNFKVYFLVDKRLFKFKNSFNIKRD